MIYEKNHVFYAIKIGKTEINSISKSIKSLMLKEKTGFVLFNLNCTPSIEHIKFCINSMPKNFNSMDLLKKLTGESQVSKIEKKTELDKTKNCCLIVFESNKEKAGKKAIELNKVFGLKEVKKLVSEKKRLKSIALKEKINKNFQGFGKDFYSALNNFFIEKSALVNVK